MTARKGQTKPSKPRKDFPLRAHNSGQWVKTVNGKTMTFGPWDDPQGAEEAWYRYKLSKHRPASASLKDLCESFMYTREVKFKDGDLSLRQAIDSERACKRMLNLLGHAIPLSEIGSRELSIVASNIRSKHKSPGSIRREIANCKTVLSFAVKQRLVDRPILFGEAFAMPSEKAIRRHRQSMPDKDFSPAECVEILSRATGVMRCFVLLGLNMGAGNTDLRTMKKTEIVDGWYDGVRNKALVPRRAKLWEETVEALAAYKRPKAKDEKHEELLFLTRYGNPYGSGLSGNDPIGQEFKKLLRRGTEIEGSFYGFRHTFETIASGCRDQQAVDLAMGHKDSSMAARYRSRIEDDRMIELSLYVHGKIFT